MGIELLFIISMLAWLGIFFYLLVLHLRQRKLAKTISHLKAASDSLKEKREP